MAEDYGISAGAVYGSIWRLPGMTSLPSELMLGCDEIQWMNDRIQLVFQTNMPAINIG
jgi:hypothetical protein